jgi:chromatin remodeling complex protein RSC6
MRIILRASGKIRKLFQLSLRKCASSCFNHLRRKLIMAKKVAKKKPAPKAKKAPAKKAAKSKAGSAFMKALKPSEKLAAVIGSASIPRTEVVKKIWAYIKKHNLQNQRSL